MFSLFKIFFKLLELAKKRQKNNNQWHIKAHHYQPTFPPQLTNNTNKHNQHTTQHTHTHTHTTSHHTPQTPNHHNFTILHTKHHPPHTTSQLHHLLLLHTYTHTFCLAQSLTHANIRTCKKTAISIVTTQIHTPPPQLHNPTHKTSPTTQHPCYTPPTSSHPSCSPTYTSI